MTKYFSALPKSYEKFLENLLLAINAATEEEILKNLKTYNSPYSTNVSNTKIKNFRNVVNAITPVVLFVNYEDIKSELNKYLTLTNTGLTSATAKLAESAFKAGSESLITGIVDAVKQGVSNFKSKNNPTVFTSYTEYIQEAVSESQFKANFFQNNKISEINSKNAGAKGTNISNIFVFNNINTAKALSDEVGKTVAKYVSSSKTDIGKINALLDLGHSIGSVEDTGEALGNFPKLTQVLLNTVLQAGITNGSLPETKVFSVEEVTSDFLYRTGQIENTVKINKQFKDGFLQIFVEAGGQVLKFENSIVNRARGRAHEQLYPGGSNSQVLASLSNYLTNRQAELNSLVGEKVVKILKDNLPLIAEGAIRYLSSPNVIKQVKLNWIEAATGKKLSNFVQDTSGSKTSKKPNQSSSNTGSKIKLKSTNTSSSAKSSTSSKSGQSQRTPNLISLQNLINSHLQDVVAANMGSGNSKNILNYQTGRFAASVKVEKLSQSREGMITAFYSYMKNPYQTFEPGFRQGSPKTRDPKLLIAKSIREIAETRVANRMRSVSI